LHYPDEKAQLAALILATAVFAGCDNSADPGAGIAPPAPAPKNHATSFLPAGTLADTGCGAK